MERIFAVLFIVLREPEFMVREIDWARTLSEPRWRVMASKVMFALIISLFMWILPVLSPDRASV